MKNNSKLYAAYGSNLNFEQMKMRCPTAELVGVGFIKGYELQFKGRKYGAYATIEPNENFTVPAALWKLTPNNEKLLDIYEGYPNHYFKRDVDVTIGDRNVTAMAYIMDLNMDFGMPTQRYYNVVYKGYRDCGFDVNVLNAAVDRSTEAEMNNFMQQNF